MTNPSNPTPWQPQGQSAQPAPPQTPYDGTQLDPTQAPQPQYGAPVPPQTPYDGQHPPYVQTPAPTQASYNPTTPYGQDPAQPVQPMGPMQGQQPGGPVPYPPQQPYGAEQPGQMPPAMPPQGPGAYPAGPGVPGAPGAPGAPKPKKGKTGLIIGIVAGVVGIIAVLAIVFAVVVPNLSGPNKDDYYAAWNKSTKLSDSYYDIESKFMKVSTATYEQTEFSDKDASDVKADAKSMQDTLKEIEGMKAHKDSEVKGKLDAAKPAVDKYVAHVNALADTAPALINAMTVCSAMPKTYMGEASYVTDGTKFADNCAKALGDVEKSGDEEIAKAATEQNKTLTTYKDLLKQLGALGNPDDYYKSGVYEKYSTISDSMRKLDLYSISSNLSDAMTKSQKASDPGEAIKDLTEVLSDKMLAR